MRCCTAPLHHCTIAPPEMQRSGTGASRVDSLVDCHTAAVTLCSGMIAGVQIHSFSAHVSSSRRTVMTMGRPPLEFAPPLPAEPLPDQSQARSGELRLGGQ